MPIDVFTRHISSLDSMIMVSREDIFNKSPDEIIINIEVPVNYDIRSPVILFYATVG